MSFKDLVSGDASCSGTNNPLNKIIPHLNSRNSHSTTRANSSPHAFHSESLFNDLSKELNTSLDFGFGKGIQSSKLQEQNHEPKDLIQKLNNANPPFNFEGKGLNPSPHLSFNGQTHIANNVQSQFRMFQQTVSPAFNTANYQPHIHYPVPHKFQMPYTNHNIYHQPVTNLTSPNNHYIQNIYNNKQQGKQYENVDEFQNQLNNSNDLSRTAGEIVNKLNAENLPKLQNSAFMGLMKKIRDGESKIENNDFVHDQKSLEKNNELSVDIIDPKLRDQMDNMKMSTNKQKETLAEMDDEDYEHAFKFDNWVDQYHNELMSINENPQNLNWDELRNKWESNITKANNPLYDHYLFSKSNKYSDQPMNVIEKALGSMNLNESLLANEALVKNNSKDADAWYRLGIKQQENEREPSAIAALRQAVNLDENQYEAWLALAVSYTNENCRSDAYEALSKWLLHNPRYKSHHTDIMFNKNDNNEILHNELLKRYLDAVNKSTSRSQFDDQLQVALGVLLNLSNDYDKAIECFQTALQVRPNDYLLWNKLGATYANNHQPEKAIESYFKALEINPSFIRARYNLAISSINISQYNEAAEHLVTALTLQKQNKDETSLLQNKDNSNTSSHIWDTLRMTLFMLNRQDLLTSCDNRDLDSFKKVFGY